MPDEWAQGFNPDRYRGFDYATSFRLQLDAQADGAVKLTGVDGRITASPLPALTSAVTALVGQVPATIQYAGPAPTATNGLMQINLQVPASAPTGSAVPIVVAIGNYVTQANATASIQP